MAKTQARAVKQPSGNWRVRVYAGNDLNGKPIYKSFTAPTAKEAQYKAMEFKLMNSRMQQPLNVTVGQAIDMYIDSKSNILSASTIRGYKHIRQNCLQSIMNKQLNVLTHQMIQQAINQDASKYSPKYVKNAHGLLSAVLGVYHPDFTLRTTLPQKQKTERHIPSDAEISRLIQTVKGTDIYIPILLSCMLSLRRSEISGLLWSDIDFTKHTLHVKRAVVLNDQKEWAIKSPKTFSSSREISIPDVLYNELTKIKGKPKEPVTALTPGQISDRFRKTISKYGFEHFRFHDLRHYNASVMLALNLPDKYAMERGGWSNPATMKNIYQHTFEDKQKQYDTLLANYFSKLYDPYMT